MIPSNARGSPYTKTGDSNIESPAVFYYSVFSQITRNFEFQIFFAYLHLFTKINPSLSKIYCFPFIITAPTASRPPP